MGDTDQEPDPSKRIPTLLWLALGLIVVVLFIAAAAITGGHVGKRAVGPPAGTPTGITGVVDKGAD